jgi:hypothetical protein
MLSQQTGAQHVNANHHTAWGERSCLFRRSHVKIRNLKKETMTNGREKNSGKDMIQWKGDEKQCNALGKE